MRVLVTGGGGFIGRAVSLKLKEVGHTPVTLDKPYDVRLFDDIWDSGDRCEAVIHMAGVLGTHELFDDPWTAVDVNVTGTLNVLEWCREVEASYVGITMPQVFPSIYTATKVAATRLATAYHHTHGVPVSHVRAFNAFGPGQAFGPGHPQKIIPTFAVNAWNNVPLPVWGDGMQTVDLVFVNDLAKMLVAALRFGDDEVFDGGTGRAFTVNDVVGMIEGIVDRPVTVDYLPMRRGEIPTNIVATGEGWDKLGWKPGFLMSDLYDTVMSYKAVLL